LEFAPTGGTEALPRSGSGSNFVLDDFTFTRPAATPEPTPLLLLVTASLAGILLMRRGGTTTSSEPSMNHINVPRMPPVR